MFKYISIICLLLPNSSNIYDPFYTSHYIITFIKSLNLLTSSLYNLKLLLMRINILYDFIEFHTVFIKCILDILNRSKCLIGFQDDTNLEEEHIE